MIDETALYNTERTDAELEEFLFFCICTAGKNAQLTSRNVNLLFGDLDANESPFACLRELMYEGDLLKALKHYSIGQYGKTLKAIGYLLRNCPDLRTCSVEELEQIPGVGPKTARFFVSMTRPNAEVAILDVHILRWMNEQGITGPDQTPTNKAKYRALEKAYLTLAAKMNKPCLQLDQETWLSRRRTVKAKDDVPPMERSEVA